MNLREIICSSLLLGFLLIFSPISGQAFPEISGVINQSSQVSAIYELRAGSNVNAVKVAEPASFSTDDIVVLYMPKGWHIITEGDEDKLGKASDRVAHRNVGAYSINRIDTIQNDTIVFVAPTPFKDSLKPGEMAQLVKVPEYKNARVTGTIHGEDWTESSGKGGVIALYVEGTLKLEADIDASGIGFEGADPAGDDYSGGCYQDDPALYGEAFYLSGQDSLAGLKGEGAVVSTFDDSIRGRIPLLNGGGGGNGKFAGGGGGSNYNPGNSGGAQYGECGDDEIGMGEGGHGLKAKYYNDEGFAPLPNRIYMGGGGGTGTQTSENNATAGGDGGGIVIIIADTIEADNTVAIKANGEDVNLIANAGAGGGGGGGCLVLDVNHYKGELHIEATGGKGGDTNNSDFYTGPGGGGGGGIYWVRNDSANLVPDYTPGEGGVYLGNSDISDALPGVKPFLLDGLVSPLNGFLFNTLPNNRTVCTDERPDTLFASQPKGGGGPDSYAYRWHFKHPADAEWDSLPLVDTNSFYVFKSKLTEPLELRRIVKSGKLEEGDDISTTYFTLDKIEGNVIGSPDSICTGLTAEQLLQDEGNTLSGANVDTDTTFRWIKSTDNESTWETASGQPDQFVYTPSGISETTIYRRVAYSGVCDDTSNAVTITVFPSITDNKISDSDTICFGQGYGGFSGLDVGGGETGNYRYAWQVSEDLINWGDSLVSASNESFNLSEYDTTKYVRRVVYSGSEDACIDTSEVDTVTVLDVIDDNSVTMQGDTITICQFNPLPDGGIFGSEPSGGDQIYSYSWQLKTPSSTWTDVSDVPPGERFNQSSFDDTTYIRRQVTSGSDGVCVDISDTLVIGMVWEINDNVLTTTDAVFCQEDLFPEIIGQVPVGGANGLGIQWQMKTGSGDFEPAPGSNSAINYTFSEKVFESYSFRRMVWSEPTDSVCVVYSDTLHFEVQDSISQNRVLEVNHADLLGGIDSICAGLDLQLNGSDESIIAGGDETNYSYTWERSGGSEFLTIDSTATGADYSEEDFRSTKYYRRIVSSGACLDTTGIMILPIELPTGSLDYASEQATEICASTETPVKLSVMPQLDPLANGYTAYLSFTSEQHSGNDQFSFDNPSDGIATFGTETDSIENYVFLLDSIIDDRGCVSEVELTGQPVVKVYYSPEATILASDTAVCGPDVELTATNKGGVSYIWSAQTDDPLSGGQPAVIQEQGLNAFASIDQWFNDTAVVTYGFKIVTSEELGLACADSVYTTVTHYQPPRKLPYFKRNAVNDFGDSIAIDSVYFADTYPLKVDNLSMSGKGGWTVKDGMYGMPGENPMNPSMVANLSDELDVDNVFVWTVRNGACEPVSDEMIVRRKDVEVYEGISPNGDGLNDYLAMRGIKYADKIRFTVFNSWGTPIYKMTEADESRFVGLLPNNPESEQLRILWDGKVNGVVVPDGTYYYTVSFTINEGTEREKSYDVSKFLVISTQLVE